jgi:hypothetical protein
MPQTPSANPNQKALLEQLKSLAQTDAVNSSNQITMLNTQISQFQEGQTLFQSRYDYWKKFVEDYELERRYLDGQRIASPLTTTDFTNFLAQTGRLFNASLPTPARLSPVRISEYDGGGLTYTAAEDEAPIFTRETQARTDLLSGFTTPTFPTGFVTDTPLSTATTVLRIRRSTATPIPTGVRFAVQGSVSSAVLFCTGVTQVTFTNPFEYDLNVIVQTPTFTTIGAGSSVLNAVTAFTNGERTAKVATVAARQSLLNGFISTYSGVITDWQNLLQTQRNAILAQTSEDAPDTAYVNTQAAQLTQTQNYFPAQDVSNAGLSAIATLNTNRTAARPTRIAWIQSRIAAVQGYDERYKYSDKLYNLSDGAIQAITSLTRQRDALVASQAQSNARAASLSSEIF